MLEMPVARRAVFRRVLAHRRHRDAIAHAHRAKIDRPENVRRAIALKNLALVLASRRMRVRWFRVHALLPVQRVLAAEQNDKHAEQRDEYQPRPCMRGNHGRAAFLLREALYAAVAM